MRTQPQSKNIFLPASACSSALPGFLTGCMLLFSSAAFAQPAPVEHVFIVSQPNEVKVQLNGAYVFLGATPLTIPHRLSGAYTLSATLRGYERKRLRLYFDQNSERKITIGLSPLSRFKAATRSLLLPGSGQRYKGSYGRGLLYSGLCFGAGIGAVATHLNYVSARNNVDDAERNYESVRDNFEQAQVAWQQRQDARQKAGPANDRRRRALYITAALWTINVLDALLLPPGVGGASVHKAHQKLSHNFQIEANQLSWQVHF
ncbi:MAG: DUF5683 domain-containing protein [bacterium]